MKRTTCEDPMSVRPVQEVIMASRALLASLVILVGVTAGQEPDSPPEAPTVVRPEHASADRADATTIPEHHPAAIIDVQKRKKAFAALMAVAGIAICGVGAIAATMLWARHLRRLARDPGTPQKTAGNDFWFLKPPKQTAVNSDIGDAPQPPFPPSTGLPE